MVSKKDTIFALSSAYGKAGVSVFRISGPASLSILSKLTKGKKITPNKMFYSGFYNPKSGEILDTGMAVFFKSPASYTGEDTVELFTHGSIAIVDVMYDVLGSFKGVRLAEPGEFTKQAFLNGRLDLTQVEAVADLIEAQTESQRKLALKNANGEEAKLYSSWREKLVKILAWYEASIDFSDDEMPEDIILKSDKLLSDLIIEMKKHIETEAVATRIKNGLNVVIIGKPNVGKSSLFNKIIGENKAIVSSIAGTTRDVIDASLDINGFKINLSDTAGLNEKTKDKIEKKGILKANKIAKLADIKIYVVDNLKSIDKKKIDADTILILNKIDKKKNVSIDGLNIIPMSVKSGENFEKFWKILTKKIKEKMVFSNDITMSQQRYKVALSNCVEELSQAIKTEAIDLKVEHIRIAVAEIGAITGQVYFNELLDEIFSHFCLGK
ncbi:tRNA uridine-5-carboxymethylaminomethyl(34) synthesis GTPase MnmE [bacterium]|nr:tRNA uridine-5-carboxymethylaminomethyl(34) synthesis GTPase MnmE [bacterium]